SVDAGTGINVTAAVGLAGTKAGDYQLASTSITGAIGAVTTPLPAISSLPQITQAPVMVTVGDAIVTSRTNAFSTLPTIITRAAPNVPPLSADLAGIDLSILFAGDPQVVRTGNQRLVLRLAPALLSTSGTF
ncbi:hypothetical protein, partial [Nitrospirillum amazonense]|uniref:hypothetical protein n=1 Tax=Nitrospirillum amazonense TaxID=28077 RepID=UPI0024125CEA